MDSPSIKYRNQIAEAWGELIAFETVRDITIDRIDDLRTLIRATANLLPDEERKAELMMLDVYKHPTNITEAVRFVLVLATAKKQRLTPIQVREEIGRRGFHLSDYTNPLASIHTIMRRMKDAIPQEVDYDEATGTFGNASPMSDMVDIALRKRITDKVLKRMVVFDDKKTQSLIEEEVKKLTESLSKKRKMTED